MTVSDVSNETILSFQYPPFNVTNRMCLFERKYANIWISDTINHSNTTAEFQIETGLPYWYNYREWKWSDV